MASFRKTWQNENGSDNPVFLSVNYAAGHNMGSTIDEFFTQLSREYSFLLWQCGDKELQVKN